MNRRWPTSGLLAALVLSLVFPSATYADDSEGATLSENEFTAFDLSLGYGHIGESPLDASASQYFLARSYLNAPITEGASLLMPMRFRLGRTDAGGGVFDMEGMFGFGFRLGPVNLGVSTGLALAAFKTDGEGDLGGSARIPLQLSAQTSWNRFLLVAQAQVGRATGELWQNGSELAPTGDYFYSDLTLWTPPILGAAGLTIGARYEEFGDAEMTGLSLGIGFIELDKDNSYKEFATATRPPRAQQDHSKEEKKSKNPSFELPTVYYVDASWRTWLNLPSRVPGRIGEDDRGPLAKMAQAYSFELGAVVHNLHAAVKLEQYAGATREDVTSGVYQFQFGLGGVSKEWDEGGPVTIRNTSSAAHPDCPKYDSFDDEYQQEAKARQWRSNKNCRKRIVTTTASTFDLSPTWIYGHFAGYGGLRYARNMLGGEEPGEDSPLVDGVGPVVGVSGFLRRGALALVISQEFAYYASGWDDHGKFGWTGRVGFGAPFALFDMRWRLDSAVGKEFMFGLTTRLDLF